MDEISNPAISELVALGIPFEVRSHEPVSSLAEAAAARGVAPSHLVKTMVVRRAEESYVMVLVPGDRVIAWPRLRRLLGESRLSMADAQTAKAVTGYERGTITPFGTRQPLPVVVDERILDRTVSIGGGDHGVGILLSGSDLVDATDATVADVTDPAG